MELCQGRGSWGSGNGSAPEGGQALEQAAQGSDGVQRVFGQRSQAQSLNFEWDCGELGVGLSDPYGSPLSHSKTMEVMAKVFCLALEQSFLPPMCLLSKGDCCSRELKCSVLLSGLSPMRGWGFGVRGS